MQSVKNESLCLAFGDFRDGDMTWRPWPRHVPIWPRENPNPKKENIIDRKTVDTHDHIAK